jgi:pseudaminic acid biosynthesis-associated methylase
MKTEQMQFWEGSFGKEYTDRNPQNIDEMDALYKKCFGVSRSEINKKFLEDIPRNAKILEVGCNIGLQLQLLQKMGFTNLYGIELQEYAVEKAKTITKNINIIQGSGFDIPFRDGYFNLVYTSGVLIHINPDHLPTIISEIYRCTSKYIFGFEYYAEKLTNILYRGNEGYLWKNNFSNCYQQAFKNLKTVKEEKYKYTDSENVDQSFLLEK